DRPGGRLVHLATGSRGHDPGLRRGVHRRRRGPDRVRQRADLQRHHLHDRQGPVAHRVTPAPSPTPSRAAPSFFLCRGRPTLPTSSTCRDTHGCSVLLTHAWLWPATP